MWSLITGEISTPKQELRTRIRYVLYLFELLGPDPGVLLLEEMRHSEPRCFGSGFNQVSGSGAGIQILIQEGKNDQQI